MFVIPSSRGYTFVELVIAMAISSFVLLALFGGIIRLFNIYEAGIAIRQTQDVIRKVSDELTANARSAAGYRVYQNDVNVGTASGNLPLHQDRVCLYNSLSALADNPAAYGGATERGTGEVYYTEQPVGASSANDTDKSFTLKRATISNVLVWPVTETDSTKQKFSCPIPGEAVPVGVMVGEGAAVSPTEVTIPRLSANRACSTTCDPRMISFSLSVAADSSRDDLYLNYSNPDNISCKGTFGEQFCSVTQADTSAVIRREGSGS